MIRATAMTTIPVGGAAPTSVNERTEPAREATPQRNRSPARDRMRALPTRWAHARDRVGSVFDNRGESPSSAICNSCHPRRGKAHLRRSRTLSRMTSSTPAASRLIDRHVRRGGRGCRRVRRSSPDGFTVPSNPTASGDRLVSPPLLLSLDPRWLRVSLTLVGWVLVVLRRRTIHLCLRGRTP
jgi:hypothetical protein